jgi:hypothetical protein
MPEALSPQPSTLNASLPFQKAAHSHQEKRNINILHQLLENSEGNDEDNNGRSNRK